MAFDPYDLKYNPPGEPYGDPNRRDLKYNPPGEPYGDPKRRDPKFNPPGQPYGKTLYDWMIYDRPRMNGSPYSGSTSMGALRQYGQRPSFAGSSGFGFSSGQPSSWQSSPWDDWLARRNRRY